MIHDFAGLYRRIDYIRREGMQRILHNIVEAMGEALLNQIIDEIARQDLIDTGAMWNSFSHGGDNNVWTWDVDRNAVTLEIGSNLPYAQLLNDGYTITKQHFVPGYWNSGGSFVYDPGSKTGFMAKPRTFIGRHYFDIAVNDFRGGMNTFMLHRLEVELGRMLR
ncbi:HK97 gp10 family phage protein [Paenibacillus kandeliae]|uniref:HK97 gp10 family phage protein n=1 Tax=Paenibacillus kandeliae TaxID=3231269 RepID=UPI003458A481